MYWRRESTDILGQFRAAVGRCPHDPRVRELLRALTAASTEFVAMWSEHPVQAFTPATKRSQQPAAGRIAFLPASPADGSAP